MRELTKSMLSYGWAMSVFGVQQTMNLLTPNQGGSAKAMRDVANATVETFGQTLKAVYRAGDNLQGGMVDIMFGMMGGGMDMNRFMSMGNDAMQQMSGMGRRAADSMSNGGNGSAGRPADAGAPSGSGWGPMPR